MPSVNEVVVAVSAVRRPWAMTLRAYIQDHVQSMTAISLRDPTLVTDGDLDVDVVVVDDVVCLFDAAAIGAAANRDIRFVGLTDDISGRGRGYLMGLGVDLILSSSTSPVDIVAAIRSLTPRPRQRREVPQSEIPARATVIAGDLRPGPQVAPNGRAGRLGEPERRGLGGASTAHPLTVVQKCCGGAGARELAVLIARRFAAQHPALLIEADETCSGLVARLHLTPDRCLPHALGLVAHGQHLWPAALSTPLDDGHPHPRFGLDVIAGAMTPGGPPINNAVHFAALLDAATVAYADIVVQVGPLLTSTTEPGDRFATGRAAVAAADRLVAVTLPTPEGVTRLVNWLAAARTIAPETPAFAVFGLVPRSAAVRAALRRELAAQTEAITAAGFESTALLPFAEGAAKAAWNGSTVPWGRLRRAANSLADHLSDYPVLPGKIQSASNGHRRMGAAR